VNQVELRAELLGELDGRVEHRIGILGKIDGDENPSDVPHGCGPPPSFGSPRRALLSARRYSVLRSIPRILAAWTLFPLVAA
jgi:hypothetical protein